MSGFSSICVGTSCGVHIFMLLNLCNLKYLLFCPSLFCVKKIGPGSSIKIARERPIKIGERITNPPKDNTTSNALFTYFS